MSHHHRRRRSCSSSSSSSQKKRRRNNHGQNNFYGGQQPYNPQMGGQYGQGQYGHIDLGHHQYGQGQYGGQQIGGYGQQQYGGYGQNQQIGGYGFNQPQMGNYGQQYNQRDQLLRNKIDLIYQRYDRDGSGQLEERQFAGFFGELCQLLNVPPPSNYQEFISIARQTDTNYDGRISKMELFNLFKRVMRY